MAESKGIRNGGRYHKPRRDLAQKEIRRLLVTEGLSNKAVAERTGIPERTIERYVADLYRRDRELLTRLNPVDMVIDQRNLCRARFESHRLEILANICRNPQVSVKDQLAAWNLIYESESAELRLLQDTASMVMRRLPSNLMRGGGGPLPYSTKQFYGDDQENKEEQEEQEDDIEVVDEFNDDGEIKEEATREEKDSKALTWEHKTSNEKFR